MYIHVHIKVIPLGTGTGISKYVAEVVKILRKLGYNPIIESGETAIEIKNIEEIGKIAKHVHERLTDMSIKRILTFISIDYRIDKTRSIKDKISFIQAKLQ